MTGLRSIIDRYERTFDARDWDGWTELLDEEVQFTTDTGTSRGRDAARAYASGLAQRYPGLRNDLYRVVAESGDMIVVESQLGKPGDDPSHHEREVGGFSCDVVQVRDERIVAVRSYYAPVTADRTDAADVPSGVDAARIAEEQAALRRLATLVAEGVAPDRLFAAVSEEVGRLLDADLAGMIRFESDDMIVAVATWAATGGHADVSGRWPLEGDRIATRIFTSSQPTREDAWADVDGPIAAFVRGELGVHSSVGSPIVVDGRVWGALFVHSTSPEPLAASTEVRLGQFTQLVATAMANAQAHEDLHRLAEEQAALRRVAELVARGAPANDVFATVAEELGRLIKVAGAKMLRYEQDETVTFVASWGPLQAGLPVGSRISVKGNSVSAQIFETWQPARVEDYVTATGPLAAHLHREGMQSAVGAPIVVDGRLWGALLVGSVQIDPLPLDTEERIAQFAKLVATAISNLEARAEAKRLAEEQGALRRVAELVAQESSAESVFSAVAQELGGLLSVSSASVLRFDTDNTGIVMAAWGMPELERAVGRQLPLTGNSTAALALKTGRPARLDDYSTPKGPISELLSALGATSTVACPVVVVGRVWGINRSQQPSTRAAAVRHRGASSEVHGARGNRNREHRRTRRTRRLARANRRRQRRDAPAL